MTSDHNLAYFAQHANALQVDFPQILDIPAIIDYLEEHTAYGSRIHYPPTADSLSLQLSSTGPRIEFSSTSLQVSQSYHTSLQDLVKNTFSFFQDLQKSPVGIPGLSTKSDSG